MPRRSYADMNPDERERQRAHVRKSLKKTRLRRIDVYASTPETLAKARAQMPPGLPLQDFLSQLIDHIAAGSLVPRPPSD